MAGFLSLDQLFKGRHFEREIIILCVRWYLRFKLSLRDLVEMMAERGLSLAHTTIMRWVQRFVPEFERRWNHFARQSGQSWRVDEVHGSNTGHKDAASVLRAESGVVLIGAFCIEFSCILHRRSYCGAMPALNRWEGGLRAPVKELA